MSYKEQQEEEICAIESIYTENEVISINKEYPNVELELELNSAGVDNFIFLFHILFSLESSQTSQ